MAAESLREELMALPGVAEAEVDESGDSPSGVRVRLESDADAATVGAEVQRVLANHGMRSRITSGDEEEAPPAEAAAVPPPLIPPPPLEPPPITEPVEDAVPPPADLPELDAETEAEAEPAPDLESIVPAPVEEPIVTPVPGFEDGQLASVSMTETDDGVEVVVTTVDGRSATRPSAGTPEAMMEATVDAVGELADEDAVGIIKLEVSGANGSQVVTVVVERTDGSRAAGASLIRVGSAYAVARATWAALKNC